jgi:hypothetical protein
LFWHDHIETIPGWAVRITRDASNEEFSRAEETLLDEISAKKASNR